MTLLKSLNKLSTWFAFLAVTLLPLAAFAEEEEAKHGGGEANLILPDLSTVEVLGMTGHSLLLVGLLIAALGIGFGVMALYQVKNLPAHKSMTDVSELIWETCKTYLITQGKFILMLEVLIGAIIAF
jgi:K(+)-stimulated pyrophosphate-energized sodium pump